MALNIHTDETFEKQLNWLSRHMKQTKTAIIKDLVQERYRLKKQGFGFGALKQQEPVSSAGIQRELKHLDEDHDLA